MEKKMTGGSVIILSIVLVASLLVAVIGATYAYFRVAVTKTNVSSMTVTAADLKITYTETQKLQVTNVVPGWSGTKKFTIQNTGSKAVSYTIKWSSVSNTMVNKDDVTYEMTATNSGCTKSSTKFPTTAENICSGTITNGVTQEFTVTVNYANTSSDQSSDMTRGFAGLIDVTAANQYQ